MVRVPHKKHEVRHGETTTQYQDSHCLEDTKEFDEVPKEIAYDRYVCRFWGFYKQSVFDSNLENFRVRNVKRAVERRPIRDHVRRAVGPARRVPAA